MYTNKKKTEIFISNEERMFINILFKDHNLKKEEFDLLNYDILVKIVSSHLMLPSLYVNLKEKNYLKYIPNNLNSYLREIYDLNQKRNEILLKEVKTLEDLLTKNKIDHVFLKGTANIIAGIYSDFGERMLGDIDILVKNSDKQRVIGLMNRSGFNFISDYDFFETIHLNKQIHNKNLFAVEIHLKLLHSKNKLLRSEAMLENKIRRSDIFIPNYLFQLMHNIYNYQINDKGFENLSYSYRSIYDTFLILKKINNIEIDPNIYLNRYFMILNELNIPITNLLKFKIIKLDRFRFRLKKTNKFYSKLENYFLKIVNFLKTKPYKVIIFLTNKNYRKFIMAKYYN